MYLFFNILFFYFYIFAGRCRVSFSRRALDTEGLPGAVGLLQGQGLLPRRRPRGLQGDRGAGDGLVEAAVSCRKLSWAQLLSPGSKLKKKQN